MLVPAAGSGVQSACTAGTRHRWLIHVQEWAASGPASWQLVSHSLALLLAGLEGPAVGSLYVLLSGPRVCMKAPQLVPVLAVPFKKALQAPCNPSLV